MSIYEFGIDDASSREEISKLLKKLKELHDNRKDYIPNKATEDYDFLCGYCAAIYYPVRAEKDVQEMIKKYLIQ